MSDDVYIALDVHQVTPVVSVLNAAGHEVSQSVMATKGEPIPGFPAPQGAPPLCRGDRKSLTDPGVHRGNSST